MITAVCGLLCSAQTFLTPAEYSKTFYLLPFSTSALKPESPSLHTPSHPTRPFSALDWLPAGRADSNGSIPGSMASLSGSDAFSSSRKSTTAFVQSETLQKLCDITGLPWYNCAEALQASGDDPARAVDALMAHKQHQGGLPPTSIPTFLSSTSASPTCGMISSRQGPRALPLPGLCHHCRPWPNIVDGSFPCPNLHRGHLDGCSSWCRPARDAHRVDQLFKRYPQRG